MAIKLIAGLGNPGSAYADTRHNVGAWFVESLAAQNKGVFKTEKKFFGTCSEIHWPEQSCMLFLPHTFMNESGRALQAISHFYHYESSEILVVHDDLDLLPGMVKFKTDGGSAGHNGLRDIIACLQDPSFHRLRIGIGKPTFGSHEDKVNYVLGKPTGSEKSSILQAITRALETLPMALSDLSRAMQLLHT